MSQYFYSYDHMFEGTCGDYSYNLISTLHFLNIKHLLQRTCVEMFGEHKPLFRGDEDHGSGNCPLTMYFNCNEKKMKLNQNRPKYRFKRILHHSCAFERWSTFPTEKVVYIPLNMDFHGWFYSLSRHPFWILHKFSDI